MVSFRFNNKKNNNNQGWARGCSPPGKIFWNKISKGDQSKNLTSLNFEIFRVALPPDNNTL